MNLSARRGVSDQHHIPAALPLGKRAVPIVQVGGWAPGPVWTGAENVFSTGIRSPDRPSHSKSLYRLRYPTKPLNILLEESHFKFVLRKDRGRHESIWGDRGLGECR